MLTIYTGNCEKAFSLYEQDIPRNPVLDSMSPWEQMDYLEEHVDEFKNTDVVFRTYSPYVLNYINLWFVRGTFKKPEIEVYELLYDEETDDVVKFDLNIANGDSALIDTRSLSDPISWIYEQYEEEKKHKEENTEEK